MNRKPTELGRNNRTVTLIEHSTTLKVIQSVESSDRLKIMQVQRLKISTEG